MGKIIMFNLVTVDGFFAGKNRELFWHTIDDEFRDFAAQQLHDAGGLLFGSITYEMMAAYWTMPEAMENDQKIAELMNSYPKIVFSHTLQDAAWNNTTLIKENIESEIKKIKQSGDDYLIFGSAELCSTLTQLGLINEYRVMVNPLVLGEGIPLFKQKDGRLKLKLIKTRIFESGNVLLCYEPVSG